MLLLDINAQGKVDSVGIAQPADPPGMGFDEAAIVAAQQFEFEPAEMGGKPIAVQLSYKYKFKLAAQGRRRRRPSGGRRRRGPRGGSGAAPAPRAHAGGELLGRPARARHAPASCPACW